MKRGKGKGREHDGGSDDDAPPDDASRVGETREERAARKAREARLQEMQLADLGVDRASAITGDDTKKNTTWVDVKALERTRAANTPGTQEYKDAQANKDHLGAWQRAWVKLQDDGTHDGKYDINDGQSHREEMRKRLEQEKPVPRSSGPKHYQDHSRGGVRGGRTSSSGRGGGVIGTRGRGHAVVSSSRSTPAAPVATTTYTRNNHINNHRIRGRGAPLPTLVEEAPSRRPQPRHPAPVVSAVTTNLQVPRQRQALAYNIGEESGSRDAFRAAMNRHTVVTSTPSQTGHSATPSHVSPLQNQQASTAMSSQTSQSTIQSHVLPTPSQRAIPSPLSTATQPAAIIVHQSIEPSDTLFGAEIDMAPIGTRIPTPPPPQTASIRSSSAESYLTDLQGLDLSPSLPQDAWGPSITNQESNIRSEIPAGEAQVSSNERERKSRKEKDDDVKPATSVKAEKNESSHETAAAPAQPSRGQSPVRQTAQMLLAQLLASSFVQSDPDLARNVAQLQAQFRLSQPLQSATSSREVLAAQNASAIVATDSQAPSIPETSQSTPAVQDQSATSNQSSSVSPGIPGPTRHGLTYQRPTVKLPKPEKTEGAAQDRGNVTTSSTITPTARPSVAARLEDMQRRWTESIEAALGNIPPIRGDLRDSEYSNPFFHGRLVGARPIPEQGQGIIGNHNLPAGQQRTRNGSLSSSVTNLSSQATIRPFASPKNRVNEERALNDLLHTKSNSQKDANALSLQLENIHLKDRREKPTAKVDSKRNTSPVKLVTVAELTERYAKKPSSEPKTKEQARAAQTQSFANLPDTNVAPQVVEQSRVARRLNGVPLEEVPYPFATRSVKPRAQNNEWFSLTSTSTPSMTATAPATTVTSSASSRSLASNIARVRDIPSYPDNAITRQYAQAGRLSPTHVSTQGTVQRTPAPAPRQSTLSPQAASFVAPQTSRSTASSAPTVSATSSVFSGNMNASRWGDAPAPTVRQASARAQQASSPATNTPGPAIGGNMHSSRWGDNPQTAVSQTPAQTEEASAAAMSTFSRDVLGTTWGTMNDVEITRTLPQSRAPASGTRNQAVGGGVAASRWNPSTAPLDADIHGLRPDHSRPARENALPIHAPREIVTDPGIGDTSELFHNYSRPHEHILPPFLRGDLPPTDPGEAVRRQYGHQFVHLPENTSQENQPIVRSTTKSLTGSDVSNSRQELVRGRRL